VTGSMVDDASAREAVRQLMRRFDLICGQGSARALVLAKRYPQKYARLLEAAEVALRTMIQPIRDADAESRAVYAALDDPRADWSKAVVAMLDRGPIESSGEQALERFKLLESLEERFEAEMKKINKSDEEEEPGN
jgi:hypothetical protein